MFTGVALRHGSNLRTHFLILAQLRLIEFTDITQQKN